jgi:hypothetical protein
MVDLLQRRDRLRALGHTLVLAFSAVFFVALVPAAVLLSGPVYRALACTFGSCEEAGRRVRFALPTRGALQLGSSIRLPNGQPVGTIQGFEPSPDERYTLAVGRLFPGQERLLGEQLRCEVSANFNLQMDADLVVSACPGLDLPRLPPASEALWVCGSVDHFQRMGQELRRFVLENIRPGEHPEAVRLSGPCGADNEAATQSLRALLGLTPPQP